MTIERNRWTLAQTITGLAFLTLVLAALLARPDREGLVSVAAVGHVLWGLVLARGVVLRQGAPGYRRCLVTAATAASIGTVEVVAAWLCWRASDPDLTCWFALAASLAIAALVSAVREEPTDVTFVTQLLFHGMMLLPFVALVAQAVLAAQAPASTAISGAGPLLRKAVLVESTLVPCFVAVLATAIGVDLAQPKPQRKGAWSAILLNELALTIMLSRWSLDLR